MPSCLRFDWHVAWRAFSRAWAKTGNRIAARIAIIAITTRSSINVNARDFIVPDLLRVWPPPCRGDGNVGQKCRRLRCSAAQPRCVDMTAQMLMHHLPCEAQYHSNHDASFPKRDVYLGDSLRV